MVASPVTATMVGCYFVEMYYQMFQQHRELVHQFYKSFSSMLRIDGELTHSALNIADIHNTLMSLKFTGIVIKTINSFESWGGVVIAFVSGSVKSKSLSLSISREFVQTFFLAPQENGYFLLHDVFHFAGEDLEQHYSDSIPVVQVPHYQLEEEARGNLNSTPSDRGEPVPEHSYNNQHDDSSVLLHSSASTVQEPQPSVDEPSQNPEKRSYALILREPPPVSSAIFTREPLPAADWNHQPQPLPVQPTPSPIKSGADTVEESSSFEEGTTRTVYLRNLPPKVTEQDIFKEFKVFGEIKPDGVFLKTREDIGICNAFVDYDDAESVRKALEASPIQMSGRNVYIEEKKQNTGAFRGGRGGGRGRGRGRGGGRDRSFGRGK